MRIFIEGAYIGRATGYSVEAAGKKVTLQITMTSDNELVLALAEAVVAHTCTCGVIRGLTTQRDERVPTEGCPVHPPESDDDG